MRLPQVNKCSDITVFPFTRLSCVRTQSRDPAFLPRADDLHCSTDMADANMQDIVKTCLTIVQIHFIFILQYLQN